LTLNELCTEAHAAAVAKGWYERHRDMPELLMLVVSELSEALEADRHGHWIESSIDISDNMLSVEGFERYVKDSVEDELADAFIRLFDICGYYNIDIQSHVAAKMKYNETRPHKHGKAY
jgi:NTP pyrophosphatase (non-canonical NTP hydrolase)